MIDVHKVINLVSKALDYQFEGYSWENMIDDTELTPEEKAWAKEHVTYTVEEI